MTYRVLTGAYRHRMGHLITATTIVIPMLTPISNKLMIVRAC